jgi:hypothetical protein
MEYVIRLEDKRMYDALIGFLRTLGANVKGTAVSEKTENDRDAGSVKKANDDKTRNQAFSEMLAFASAHPLKLPKGYRFDRDELYDE